jgi:hypothetical protein
MSSFPTRITRVAYGPPRKDTLRAGDPSKTVNKADFERMFWQLTGAGLMVPILRLAFTSAATTGALVLNYHFESWDVEGTGPPPVLTRTATGTYRVTYPTAVLNVNGDSVPLALYDARCSIQGGVSVLGWTAPCSIVSPNVIEVTVGDATNARTDTATRLEVCGL